MMENTKRATIIWLALLAIALLVIQPVSADILKTTPAVTDKMSIAYRGNGGYLIGNSIIFDGKNSAGNVTVLKLTGPGLPASGVPLGDLYGNPGSGSAVNNDLDGTWRYIWYTSNVKGIDTLQTARYTITAVDLAQPEYAAATSIFLKKPDFSVTVDPGTVKPGEYVQIFGNAENGINSVRIDVTDLSGNVLRNYEAAVSASGYFNSGFHTDMPPGQYQVVITNPLTKKTSWTLLTIASPQATVTASPAATPMPTVTLTVSQTPGTVSTTLPVQSPAMPSGTPNAGSANIVPVYALAIIGILIIVCVVVVLILMRKKTP